MLKTIFNILRWLLVTLLTLVTIILLVTGIFASSVSIAITDHDRTKSYIQKTDIYNDAIDIVLSLFEKNFPIDETFLNDFKDKAHNQNTELGQAINKILKPEILEKKVATVIDAAYDWFAGKTVKPEFKITLFDNQNDFSQLLQLVIQEKITSLPDCPGNNQISNIADPLTMDCWPKKLSRTKGADKLFNEIAKNPIINQIVDKTKLDSTSLPIAGPLTTQVQRWFPLIKSIPLIFGAIFIILSLLIFSIIPGTLAALAYLGIFYIIFGSIILFAKLILALNLGSLINSLIVQNVAGNQPIMIQNLIHKFTNNVFTSILGLISLFSLILIGIGIILVIGKVFLKKYKDPKESQKNVANPKKTN